MFQSLIGTKMKVRGLSTVVTVRGISGRTVSTDLGDYDITRLESVKEVQGRLRHTTGATSQMRRVDVPRRR